jgi:hypothetical protein
MTDEKFKAEVRAELAADIARAKPDIDVGDGWRLLEDGEPLQAGDVFMLPGHPEFGWIDFNCRPDAFRGLGEKVRGGWKWRRKKNGLNDLLVACEMAYRLLADVEHKWPLRHTVQGQKTLCALRDVIAAATGRTAEQVQDDYADAMLKERMK